MFTAVDFFSGSGLVSLGLDSMFKTIWANDIDHKKAKVFEKNFGNEILSRKDILQVTPDEVPHADLYWASFPCQDFSLAGHYAGLRGSRSSLVNEFLRLLDLKTENDRPTIAVLENVYGLITANGGQDYRSIHQSLVSLGYQVGCIVLDAANWVPQSRVRVFIIAAHSTCQINLLKVAEPNWAHPIALRKLAATIPDFIYWNLPEPQTNVLRLRDVVDRVGDDKSSDNTKHVKMINPQHLVRLHQLLKEDSSRVFSGYKRTRNGSPVLEIRFDEIGGCLRTASGGSSKQFLIYMVNDEMVVRYMTPREAARLMGAPEDYWLPPELNSAYTAMGDAVVVPVTMFISEKLLAPIVSTRKTDPNISSRIQNNYQRPPNGN